MKKQKPMKEEVVPNRNKKSNNNISNKRTTVGSGATGQGYTGLGSAKK